VGPAAGPGGSGVDVRLAGGGAVATVLRGAAVVLLVAGQDLVLDELDDVGQRELFPADAAGQRVAAYELRIG
jgi:hypothetical protein